VLAPLRRGGEFPAGQVETADSERIMTLAKSFKDQVREGMDVFDANNEKVGTLAESVEGYMRVPSGFLGMGKEHYVPLSAIREIHGDEIHLNVNKDRLDELESDVALTTDDGDFDGTLVERTVTTTPVAESAKRGGRMSPQDDDQRTLQLREEELTARKQSVQTGEVTLSKDVVSEQRTMDVPVKREEVTIERHPVDRRPSDQPISETGETISVPLHEEQVRAEKRTVVYEEVGVDKRAAQETEHVSETVQREELVIDKDGEADVEEANTRHTRPS
jgi:uncharacterized protein (TIGR02271 family)